MYTKLDSLLRFRHIIPFIAMTGLCLSCEQSYDIDSIQVETRVVVQSIYSDLDVFKIKLLRSKSIFDTTTTQPFIGDATMMVTDASSGVEYIFEHQGHGLYTSDSMAATPGCSYELDIALTDGERVHAKSYIPHRVEVNINGIIPVNSNGEEGIRIDFDIVDDEHSRNYYVWDVITSDYPNAPRNLNQQFAGWIRNSDGAINPVRYGSGTHWKVFSDDSNLAGSILNTSVIAFEQGSAAETDEAAVDSTVLQVPEDSIKTVVELRRPTVTLRVQAVSRDLYEYYQSVELYHQNGATNTSYSSPSYIYSNIKGGHGIFAGYSETRIVVE